MVPAAEFRAALRRARVFVHGARWEDWGQAPLEALADGALLATVPAGGPYEGLRLARQLDDRLVAERIDPAALAPAIRAAFDMPDERVRAYRERATELLAPYRSESRRRRSWPASCCPRFSRTRRGNLGSVTDVTLVTGAGGFIGGHLVKDLLARGQSVRAVDIKPAVRVAPGVRGRGQPHAPTSASRTRASRPWPAWDASTTSPRTWAAWGSSRATRPRACCRC